MKSYNSYIDVNDIVLYDATSYCPSFGSLLTPQHKFGLPNFGDYVLYNTKTGKPNYLEVMQGGIGNCVLDSLLALMAYNMPEELKSRIVKDPTTDHVYYVLAFNKLISKPILVKISALIPLFMYQDMSACDRCPRCMCETGAFDKLPYDSVTRKPIIWSYLMLKTYVCLTDILMDTMGQYWGNPNAIGYERLDSIDGHSVHRILVGVTKLGGGDQITTELLTNVNDPNYYMQCSVYPPKFPSTNRYKINNNFLHIYNSNNKLENILVMGHAYSVIWYDQTSKQITLRNPWGEQFFYDFDTETTIKYKNGIVILPEMDVINTLFFWWSYRR